MVIQEIEMASGQQVDLGERLIDLLRIETLPPFEERNLVAEVASMRTSARHHYRVRH